MVKSKHPVRSFFARCFGKTPGDIVFNCLNYLLFLLLFAAFLYPFYYVLKESLIVQYLKPDGNPATKFSLESYFIILNNDGLGQSFLLSIGITLAYTVLAVLITMLSAYPLSRKEFKGRNAVLIFLVISMLFSGGLIPYYLVITQLGLKNNPLVYILVGLVSPFNIIIARNFIKGIPEEVFDSARVDGASETRIVFQIVFPLSGPIVATIALWVAVGKWNDWMTGVLYMQNRKDLWMVQQFLRNILITSTAGEGVVDPDVMAMATSVKMAAIVISVLPIILVYPFVQKHFVKGVLLGSVKG